MSVVILRGCENIQSGPRWWSLRCEIKERGGGDAVASVTTSDAEIAAQPPPARRVTGGAPSSASPPLLNDGPASPASRRLASDGAAPVTRATLDFFTASELAERRSRVAQRRTPSANALIPSKALAHPKRAKNRIRSPRPAKRGEGYGVRGSAERRA